MEKRPTLFELDSAGEIGEAGDVVAMPAWTMHTLSMNCSATPRFMVTHTIYARTFVWHGDGSGDPH